MYFSGHHELVNQDMLMDEAFLPHRGASEDGILLQLQSLALGVSVGVTALDA